MVGADGVDRRPYVDSVIGLSAGRIRVYGSRCHGTMSLMGGRAAAESGGVTAAATARALEHDAWRRRHVHVRLCSAIAP